MVDKQRVIQIMQTRGPILPNAISKEIGLDILMSGAVLSEMSSNKQVKISSLKVGGSPLYYLPGQEAQLMRFADKLGEKERRTYELLKERKVLRDSAVTPLDRVSLRALKDFAIPLKVKTAEAEEIFWKFFMFSNKEATLIIKDLLGVKKNKPAPTPPQREEPVAPVEQQPTPAAPPAPAAQEEPKPVQEAQQTLAAEEHFERIKGDAFLESIYAFFKQNNIRILDLDVKRKNSDAEMTIIMPTPVGPLTYTVKAKNKKRLSDGDFSSAFLNAQTKKLPLLFITTGEVSKKLQEKLEKDFRGIAVKRL